MRGVGKTKFNCVRGGGSKIKLNGEGWGNAKLDYARGGDGSKNKLCAGRGGKVKVNYVRGARRERKHELYPGTGGNKNKL